MVPEILESEVRRNLSRGEMAQALASVWQYAGQSRRVPSSGADGFSLVSPFSYSTLMFGKVPQLCFS